MLRYLGAKWLEALKARRVHTDSTDLGLLSDEDKLWNVRCLSDYGMAMCRVLLGS